MCHCVSGVCLYFRNINWLFIIVARANILYKCLMNSTDIAMHSPEFYFCGGWSIGQILSCFKGILVLYKTLYQIINLSYKRIFKITEAICCQQSTHLVSSSNRTV
jgi:hypothetical protein